MSKSAGARIGLHGVAATIAGHDDILIVSHQRPDGDCIGSTIALLLGLQKLGKRVAAYNVTPLGERWAFLAGSEHVVPALPAWKPALTIFVDCGTKERVSDDFEPEGLTLNIDHHITNDAYADLNYIDHRVCSVGEQIINVLDLLGVSLTPEIASAAYTSIMTDSGSFRYENATSSCFMMAARLVAAGANAALLAQEIYESRERGEFVLTARAFDNLRLEFDGFFAWSELRESDYAAAGGRHFEPEGLSSDLRSIRGVEISCLFHDMADGSLRVNLRGKGAICCSAIAASMGGGGHYNAAGATIKDLPYEAARAKALAVIRDAVSEYLRSVGLVKESS